MNLRNQVFKTTKLRKQGIDFEMILNRKSIEEIEEILKCKICFQVMVNPYDCENCEQSFCYDCIMNLFENGKNCPENCEERKLKQSSQGIKNLLQNLIFKCNNTLCTEEIHYNDYLNHAKECPFSVLICPNLNCNKQYPKKMIEDHVNNECEFTVFTCKSCGLDYKRQGFNEHIDTCKLIYENLKMKFNLKESEEEDINMIKSSKFLQVLVYNFSKSISNLNLQFENISQKFNTLEDVYEKKIETFSDKIKNLNEINQVQIEQVNENVISLNKTTSNKFEAINQNLTIISENLLKISDSNSSKIESFCNEIRKQLKIIENNTNIQLEKTKTSLINEISRMPVSNVSTIRTSHQNYSEKNLRENFKKDNFGISNSSFSLIFAETNNKNLSITDFNNKDFKREINLPFKVKINIKNSTLNPQNEKLMKDIQEFDKIANVFSSGKELYSVKSKSEEDPKTQEEILKDKGNSIIKDSNNFENFNPEDRRVIENQELASFQNNINEKIDRLYDIVLTIQQNIQNHNTSGIIDTSINPALNLSTSSNKIQTKRDQISNIKVTKPNNKDKSNNLKTKTIEEKNTTKPAQISISKGVGIVSKTTSKNRISNSKDRARIERSPRICDHKTFATGITQNDMVKINELIKLTNKIVDKIAFIEQNMNFDELNHNLQNMTITIKETITQAWTEILKIVNPNQSQFRLDEDINHNKPLMEQDQFDILKELIKMIYEKISKYSPSINEVELAKIFDNILNNFSDLVKCNSEKCKIKSKFQTKNCEGCEKLFCVECASNCRKCDSIMCKKCLECKICGQNCCKNCQKQCQFCQSENKSYCPECLEKCDYCKSLSCTKECSKKCNSCEKKFCQNCGNFCKNCNEKICKKCNSGNQYSTCKNCQSKVCKKCLVKCELCKENVCTTCLFNCQKCKKKSCKGCSIICSNCKIVTDKECGESEFDYSCKICSSPYCNKCSPNSLIKCNSCFKETCLICSIRCSNCDGQVCKNEVKKCTLCDDLVCGKCLQNCVCSKISFCKNCTDEKRLISPHSCLFWLNSSPNFQGLKTRSFLPVPKNFEAKFIIEKLGCEAEIGLTDNPNVIENSKIIFDNIWTFKLKNGMKYSTKNSIESFTKIIPKEKDEIFIVFSYGSLYFRVNSGENQLAFDLDPQKEYYLYCENQKDFLNKICFIYIKKKI